MSTLIPQDSQYNTTFMSLPIGGKFLTPEGVCIKRTDITYYEPCPSRSAGVRLRVIGLVDFPVIQVES